MTVQISKYFCEKPCFLQKGFVSSLALRRNLLQASENAGLCIGAAVTLRCRFGETALWQDV